jgi:hypothetical protein
MAGSRRDHGVARWLRRLPLRHPQRPLIVGARCSGRCWRDRVRDRRALRLDPQQSHHLRRRRARDRRRLHDLRFQPAAPRKRRQRRGNGVEHFLDIFDEERECRTSVDGAREARSGTAMSRVSAPRCRAVRRYKVAARPLTPILPGTAPQPLPRRARHAAMPESFKEIPIDELQVFEGDELIFDGSDPAPTSSSPAPPSPNGSRRSAGTLQTPPRTPDQRARPDAP